VNNVVSFLGGSRAVFSCLDGGQDGLFVQHTDERGHKEAFGSFPDPSAAREFSANISKQFGVRVDWETFPTAYAPDRRNGEVYATEWVECRYDSGQEIEAPASFVVARISHSGESAGIYRGFETLAEAEAAAVCIARERNAVLS
jgi:hypothetical protein